MSHVDEGTLHSYLDGELPSSERAGVEAHLAQCSACRATLGEERALLERANALLGSTRPVERPAPPFEQLRRSQKRSPWHVRTSFAWAASIMLALGLGFYLRDPGSNPASLDAPSQPAVVAQNRDAAAPTPALGADQQERLDARTYRAESGRLSTRPADEVARVKSRADSAAAATPPPAAFGATARNVAPRPTLLDTTFRLEAVVVTGAVEKDAIAIRGRTAEGTTHWQIISRGAAKALLGTDPVGLPGVATRRIRRSPAPDGMVVVEQALDSSTVIQIFQRSADSPLYIVDGTPVPQSSRDRAAREADRLARFVGGLRVEISGPLSADSLNRLLEQVEPLP